MAFRDIAVIQFGTILISFVVAIIAALLGAGAWALIIREVVATLIGIWAYIFTTRYTVSITFNRRSAHAIWTFGWKLMVSRISEVIFGNFDNLMVGTVLGTAVLGHYSLAYRLSFLGHQFTQSAVHPVVFSVFSALQNAPQKLQTAFNHMIYWLVRVALLLSLLVLILGQDVVRLVYTDKWALAGVIFQNMWPFLGLLPVHEAVRHVMIGAGYINRVVFSRFIMLSFFVPALILAGLSGEILAVVWAVNLSLLLSLSLMLYHLAKMIQVQWFLIFTNPILAGLGTLIVTFIVHINLDPTLSLIWIVALHAALVLSLFCGFLLLLERKTIQNELGLIREQLLPKTQISA